MKTLQHLSGIAYEIFDHHPATAMRLIDELNEAEAKALLTIAVTEMAERWESRG